jgi:hypothetical protein
VLIERRVKAKIARTKKSDAFLRSEFDTFGSQAQVGRALRHLVEDGVLVKLGVGVYARAKPSVISGKPIPVQPVELLAEQALKKLGVKIEPSSQAKLYNSGATKQLPTLPVINTGHRRIVRKLSFGPRTVQYENNPQ